MRMHAGRTRTVVVVAIARIHLRPCARPASLEAISSEWHSARLTVAPFERNCLSRLTIAGLTKREGEDAQNQFWTLADGRAAGGGRDHQSGPTVSPAKKKKKGSEKQRAGVCWGLLWAGRFWKGLEAESIGGSRLEQGSIQRQPHPVTLA